MISTSPDLENLAPVVRRLADFRVLPGAAEPLFRDWLEAHRETLFRWTMAHTQGVDARRELAETAVAIQRLRGGSEFVAWLFGAALRAAADHASQGGLTEADLAGLAPELRAMLRLTSRSEFRREEAVALLAQRLSYVRGRLLRSRLKA